MILYSTGCPRCSIIKRILDEKGVNYEVASIDEVHKIAESYNIDDIPFAKINDKIYTTKELEKYIKEEL